MSTPSPSSSSRLIFPLLSISLFLLSLYQLLYSTSHPVDDQRPLPSRPGREGDHEKPLSKTVIGTLNLRFDGDWRDTMPVGRKGDGRDNVYFEKDEEGKGEKPWSQRRFRILDMLAFHQPPIIGFQEALHNQVLDLQTLLGPSFSHVGVGRNDGKTDGEYAPIFFDNSRYEQVESQTIWLSSSRKVGSVGWDASQTRIATFLTLRDKTFYVSSSSSSSSSLVHVVNTHFDDRGVIARCESAKLLRKAIPAYARRVEAGFSEKEKEDDKLRGLVVLIGDLNSPSTEEGYQALTATTIDEALSSSSPPFHDSLHLLPASNKAFGPLTTYTSFAPPSSRPSSSETRIDFLFLHESSRAEGWRVSRYGVVDNWVGGDGQGWMGRWSDHRAVIVEASRSEKVSE